MLLDLQLITTKVFKSANLNQLAMGGSLDPQTPQGSKVNGQIDAGLSSPQSALFV